jgi:hypothetical protein
MQNWNRNRTQVTRTWLIMALVVGGLLLAACAPSATPVAQPNGSGPKPTHTAACGACT